MGYLFFLFIVLPATELYLLIALGSEIGAASTLAIIIISGAIGATLVRQQGLGVLRAIQQASGEGRLPATELIEGLILLICGAFLLTPGFITDTVGFLALVPPLRRRASRALQERMVATGMGAVQIHVASPFQARTGEWGEQRGEAERPGRGGGVEPGVIDVTPPRPGVIDVTPAKPGPDESTPS